MTVWVWVIWGGALTLDGCWYWFVLTVVVWLGFGLFEIVEVLLASNWTLELLVYRFPMFGCLSTLFYLFLLSLDKLLYLLGSTEWVATIMFVGGKGGWLFWGIVWCNWLAFIKLFCGSWLLFKLACT